jgi:hypothetical protein
LAAGLDPVGSIVAGADLFVPKRNAGGRIDDGAGALRKMLSCVALFAVWKRGSDTNCGMAMRMKVVLVPRLKVGSEFLCGGLGGNCFRGYGSLLLGGLDTAAALSIITVAPLVCDC